MKLIEASLACLFCIATINLTECDVTTSRKVFPVAPPPRVTKDPGQTVELRWVLQLTNYTLLSLKCGLLRPEQTTVTTLAEQTYRDVSLRLLRRVLLPLSLRDRVTVSYPTSLIIKDLRKEDTNFYGCMATVYSKTGFQTLTARTQTELVVGVGTEVTSGKRSGTSSSRAIIIGVVVVVIVAILVVAIGYILVKRRKRERATIRTKTIDDAEDSKKLTSENNGAPVNGRSTGALQRLSKSDISYAPVEVTATPMDAILRHNSEKLYAVSELDEDERDRLTSSGSDIKQRDEWC